MNISEIIKNAPEKKGFKNLKDASKALGISPELLRVTINKGHIPKDTTLAMIAKKLNLDMSVSRSRGTSAKSSQRVQGILPYSFPGQVQSGQA